MPELFLFSFRIPWKPAAFHAFLLLEELEYGPETAETRNAEYGSENDILDKDRCHTECHTDDCEHPPAALAKIILSLNYNRMKYTNKKKS